MRKSATFPVRDLELFKKQLLLRTGNFFCAAFFDPQSYSQIPYGAFPCVAFAGSRKSLVESADHFLSLKNLHDETNDWLAGYFSYDLKNEIEPRSFPKKDLRWNGHTFLPAFFFQPEHIFILGNDEVTIESIDEPREVFQSVLAVVPDALKIDAPPQVQYRIKKEQYLNTVNRMREHIINGDMYEINFCQEFFAENSNVNPFALHHALMKKSPAPFSCFFKHGDQFLMCASPERFLKKEKNKLIAQPMKGTLKRSGNDEAEREQLRNDEKERAENVMIVDLVRNDLARSSLPGTVNVEELFGVYTFPQVHQMVSTVTSELKLDFATAIKNAFPMGSMTGAPKIKAMQLIDTYEPVQRNLFSGSVGFITPSGDFDFNVVIRSMLYNRTSKYLSFQTGGAIVYDSVAEKEYEESMLKAGAMLEVLGG